MITSKEWIEMLRNFVEVDIKLILTWVGSGAIVLINKFGLDMTGYEFWVMITIDGLTILSLLVALGYTISRWIKLFRDRRIDKPKKRK